MSALVEVKNLTHIFKLSKTSVIRAVDNVSFSIEEGEILGLVGESGSGKSTLARCVMNIYNPTEGQIYYRGINLCDRAERRKNRKALQTERQIIFQDSTSSLNQRMPVREILAEPLKINGLYKNRAERERFLEASLGYVGLPPEVLSLYPPELSGGQRQRVSIARAWQLNPKLLVADEPVASLDVSIQAQIINMFRHLQREHECTALFIAHDLAMMEFICDRIGVMFGGRLVELAPTKELFKNPLHPYTKALLSAIPIPDPEKERGRRLIAFEGTVSAGELTDAGNGHYVLMEKGEAL